MPLGRGGALVNSYNGHTTETFPYGHLSDDETQMFNAKEALGQGHTHDAAAALPREYTLDPATGQIREKTFWENHGDTIGFLGEAAGNFASAGLFGGAGGLTSAATSGGSKGMGFFNTIKQGLDLYNKASPAIDAVTHGAGNGPSPASAISTQAGGIEKARMEALIQEAMLQQGQDRNAQSRARLALDAPGMEAHNAVRGDVLANSRDAEISGLPSYIHVPQMSGGLRPSMLSDSSRTLGANMSRKAMLDNLSGKDVPDLTPLPEAGAYDKVLQGVGTGAGFLNAASGLFKPSMPKSDPGATYQPVGPVDTTANPGGDVAPLDPSQLPGQGIDPAILAYWQKQAQGVPDGV